MEQKSTHGKGSKVGRQGIARGRKNARLLEAKERITARNKYARLVKHTKMHKTDKSALLARGELVASYGKGITRRRV